MRRRWGAEEGMTGVLTVLGLFIDGMGMGEVKLRGALWRSGPADTEACPVLQIPRAFEGQTVNAPICAGVNNYAVEQAV